LNGVTIMVPPLRERRSEIAPLAAAFAARAAARAGRGMPSLSADVLAALDAYPWPGNIRELKNAIERAVAVAGEGTVTRDHLPPEMRASPMPLSPPTPLAPDLRGELEAIERRRILEALEKSGGHQGRAAELLGISRRTLISRLDAHGLPRPRKKL
jgi:DNA-binding NtrC family response regulator